MKASKYNRKFIRLERSEDIESTYGQPVPTFTPNGEYWGAIEGEQVLFDMEASLVRAEIHIRNNPTVLATDRLEDKATGYVWKISALQRTKEEVIATCFR